MDNEVKALNDRVKEEYRHIEAVFNEIGKVVIGQKYLLERMMIGLICASEDCVIVSRIIRSSRLVG